VIVDAARMEVVVICKTVVWVSAGSVTRYELGMVEAGWIDVSTSVRVSAGSVTGYELSMVEAG